MTGPLLLAVLVVATAVAGSSAAATAHRRAVLRRLPMPASAGSASATSCPAWGAVPGPPHLGSGAAAAPPPLAPGPAPRAAPGSALLPGLARVLAPPRWLQERLADTAVPVAPTTAAGGWLAATAAAVVAAGVAAGPAAAVVIGAAVAAAPVTAWRLLRHRAATAYEAALPPAVEAVAAALRSGASLRQALDECARATGGPVGADLSLVAGAVHGGAGVVPALEGWAARRPLSGVRLAAAALCLGAETGGAEARAVDGVAATLRSRLAVEAEARALATQARASAAVLAAAPVAFCALTVATDAAASRFLFRTPAGLALLAAGLGLDVLGALWMAHLTRRGE